MSINIETINSELTVVRNGSRLVKISQNGSMFSTRLYVNHGETATQTSSKAKTMKGAMGQAVKMLTAF